MSSSSLGPHIRNLYIFSVHEYYNPVKKSIQHSDPIVHYPSKENLSRDDERLVGLCQGLCGFVDDHYLSVYNDIDGNDSDAFLEQEGAQDHSLNGASSETTSDSSSMHTNKSPCDSDSHWTHGRCHTLMNRNTQWIFKPFQHTQHSLPKHSVEDPLEYLRQKFTSKTVLKTQMVFCFIVRKEDSEKNYKNEFGNMIDNIWRTFNIFYSPHFDIFSFKSQYGVMNQLIIEFIQTSSNSLLSQGISFLPIDAYLFVRIQAFIHRVIEQFSHALYPQTIFLFQKYMLFSSLDHHEARTITTHVGKLYNPLVQKPHNYFIYRTGPLAVDLSGGMNPEIPGMRPFSTKMPKVNIYSVRHSRASFKTSGEGQTDESNGSSKHVPPHQYLLVVDYNNIQIHWFMRENFQDCDQLFLQLQEYAEPYVDKLNMLIGEKMSAIHKFDECCKYLYFNHMNLAIMSSLLQKSHASQLTLHQHYIQILRNQFMASNNHGLKEIYFKAKKDMWIFGKYFGQREFYIIYDPKSLSLTEFGREVTRIMAIFFSSPTVTGKE